jgi:hypothetical protein
VHDAHAAVHGRKAKRRKELVHVEALDLEAGARAVRISDPRIRRVELDAGP